MCALEHLVSHYELSDTFSEQWIFKMLHQAYYLCSPAVNYKTVAQKFA